MLFCFDVGRGKRWFRVSRQYSTFVFVELCNAEEQRLIICSSHPAIIGARGRQIASMMRCAQQPRLQGRPVTMARVMIACPRLIISPPHLNLCFAPPAANLRHGHAVFDVGTCRLLTAASPLYSR